MVARGLREGTSELAGFASWSLLVDLEEKRAFYQISAQGGFDAAHSYQLRMRAESQALGKAREKLAQVPSCQMPCICMFVCIYIYKMYLSLSLSLYIYIESSKDTCTLCSVYSGPDIRLYTRPQLDQRLLSPETSSPLWQALGVATRSVFFTFCRHPREFMVNSRKLEHWFRMISARIPST